ncbi:MAG: hypothetical protein HYU52_12030 [Acidobacteria bacterium]|nr:hypothetical protein [Acidobacteriota bacterium]
MESNNVTAPAPPSSSSCLKGGAIALGCMGMLLFAAGIALLAFYFARTPSGDDEAAVDDGGGSVFGDLFGGGSGDTPADATFKGGRPVGLYFMTRYWSYTGTLEKSAWYFAPDGQVYGNLETGFSDADLAAHDGQRGTCSATGDSLTVTWSNGKSTTSDVERDGDGFAWDGGIFVPVEPFSGAEAIAGRWEGGESLSHGGSRVSVAKTLELREDETFEWDSISFVAGETARTEIAASAQGGSSGTWKLSGYSLILTDANGVTLRGIAFPYDDEDTPVSPDRFFFHGTMYKHR